MLSNWYVRTDCTTNRLVCALRAGRSLCRTDLEHGEQQVLFTTLVLVSVDGEHDRLQQLVDLRQCDQATQVGDVFGLGLK